MTSSSLNNGGGSGGSGGGGSGGGGGPGRLITVEQYDSLLARIPSLDDDPAIAILRGRG